MLIQNSFNETEHNNLLTVNFYSILYYNCYIWLIPSLKPQMKQQLLSASARALKICTPNCNNLMSFDQIHAINKRATPNQILLYKHSLLLYKIWNDSLYSKEWLALNFQQNFNERNPTVNIFATNKIKVGSKLIEGIDGLISYDWLNLSLNT